MKWRYRITYVDKMWCKRANHMLSKGDFFFYWNVLKKWLKWSKIKTNTAWKDDTGLLMLTGWFIYFVTLWNPDAVLFEAMNTSLVKIHFAFSSRNIKRIKHLQGVLNERWQLSSALRQRAENVKPQNVNTHMGHSTTKPTIWHVRQAKTQISLGIRLVWSESSLCA